MHNKRINTRASADDSAVSTVYYFFHHRVTYKLKMQVLVALLSLAVLASAAPSAVQHRSLQDDIEDILAVLPQEKLSNIVELYLTCDKEVAALAEYLQSDEFAKILSSLFAIPEIIELNQYIYDSLLGTSQAANRLRRALAASGPQEAAEYVPPSCDQPRSGGINGLGKDILSALPLGEIRALIAEKLRTSPEFRNLITRLGSGELRAIVQRLKANPDFQHLVLKAKADAVALINHVQELIGVTYY